MARNGPSFEERIRENERNNAKFCFLNPNDPYRGYYDHKVARVRDGNGNVALRVAATTWKIFKITKQQMSVVKRQ